MDDCNSAADGTIPLSPTISLDENDRDAEDWNEIPRSTHSSEFLLTSQRSPFPVYESRESRWSLPPNGASISVVQEFVLHILCLREYEFYLTAPDMTRRVYATLRFNGQTIRIVSCQEVASELESVRAALAIFR